LFRKHINLLTNILERNIIDWLQACKLIASVWRYFRLVEGNLVSFLTSAYPLITQK
jgi:hypothetical protein